MCIHLKYLLYLKIVLGSALLIRRVLAQGPSNRIALAVLCIVICHLSVIERLLLHWRLFARVIFECVEVLFVYSVYFT